MVKTYLAFLAFTQFAFIHLHGAYNTGKAHHIAVPQGTISISVPTGWTLAGSKVKDSIVFEPSDSNLEHNDRLAGEDLFTMFKRKHLFATVPCKASVSIYYKTRADEPLDWEELLEDWRTIPRFAGRYADGIKRFPFKRTEKKTVDRIVIYVQESTYDKYMEFPVKEGGVLMCFLSDVFWSPVSIGKEEYLLQIQITYFEDKYYTQRRRNEVEQEVVNLLKSFSAQSLMPAP